jgi:hypothetical protein
MKSSRPKKTRQYPRFKYAGAILFLTAFTGLLASVCPGIAQPVSPAEKATISGYIRDAGSGETLIAANVFIEETRRGATTNKSGYYTLANLTPGTHTLVVSYIGYAKFRQEVALAPGEGKRLDIDLQPTGVTAGELIVEGKRELAEQKAIGVATMTPRFVREIPAVIEADLFRAIQLLPGIKAASDFSSGLYIRGGSPDQTLILLDRTTVYNPTHFFGFFSAFNTDAIKDVRIYKGGYPAEYGGRLGSVIDIYNRDGNRKEFQGKVSLGLLASRLNLEGPLKKGSWMLAGRRSTLEPLLAALRKSIDDVPDTFYFYDLNGKLNFDPDPGNKLSLAFYSGTDKVLFPFGQDAVFDLNYGNRTLSLSWTRIFSQKVFSVFTLTGSQYFSNPKIRISATPFERVNEISDFSAKGDIEYFASDRHQIKAGFWAGRFDLNLVNRFDGEETLAERIKTNYGSAYAEYNWRPGARWNVKGGLRANYFSSGEYLRLEPRFSLEHRYTGDILIQAAYGRYYQFLTLITNEAFSGFDTWLTTDDGVPPAFGDQLVLGVKTRPSESYTVDVEVYYRTMRDLFELDPRVPDEAGLAYKELFRFGEGHAYGAELLIEKTRGRLYGFLGYTWSTSRRRFPGYNDGKFYPPKYDRIHDLNLVLNYRLSKKWRATATFNYATGQAYTRVLGAYSVQLPTSSLDRNPFIVGGLNAARLPAYHRFDLGLTRSGKFFVGGAYKLSLQVINLYSRRNLWFYSYDLNNNPITREDVRMLPIVPNISLTVAF